MTEPVISAARVFWRLGDAPVRLIAARENRVFRVDREEGPAALRLHRPGYRSEAELRSELKWMAMLAEQGMQVPAPIAGADGHLMVQGEVAVDLLGWVEGVPMSAGPVTEEIYRALGGLLGRMHDLADAWVTPDGFTRPEWDLVGDTPLWGRFWENPALEAGQVEALRGFRDRARGALDKGNWDRGLIHADLVPDNVMIVQDGLCPIDFDDGGYGHRLFDLATVTFRSRRNDPSGGLARAAVEGYAAQRPCDQEALSLFEAMRACSYVGWNITRMGEDGGRARNDRFIAEALEAIERV